MNTTPSIEKGIVAQLMRANALADKSSKIDRHKVLGRIVADNFGALTALLEEIDRLRVDAFGNPRVRHVRVTVDGTSCICRPDEVSDWAGDDPSQSTLTDVWLSYEEVELLPEFEGF